MILKIYEIFPSDMNMVIKILQLNVNDQSSFSDAYFSLEIAFREQRINTKPYEEALIPRIHAK